MSNLGITFFQTVNLIKSFMVVKYAFNLISLWHHILQLNDQTIHVTYHFYCLNNSVLNLMETKMYYHKTEDDNVKYSYCHYISF